MRRPGKTATQLLRAPSRAIFVCAARVHIEYTERLARALERPDIRVVGPSFICDEQLTRYGNWPIVLDHAVELEDEALAAWWRFDYERNRLLSRMYIPPDGLEYMRHIDEQRAARGAITQRRLSTAVQRLEEREERERDIAAMQRASGLQLGVDWARGVDFSSFWDAVTLTPLQVHNPNGDMRRAPATPTTQQPKACTQCHAAGLTAYHTSVKHLDTVLCPACFEQRADKGTAREAGQPVRTRSKKPHPLDML